MSPKQEPHIRPSFGRPDRYSVRQGFHYIDREGWVRNVWSENVSDNDIFMDLPDAEHALALALLRGCKERELTDYFEEEA